MLNCVTYGRADFHDPAECSGRFDVNKKPWEHVLSEMRHMSFERAAADGGAAQEREAGGR